MLTIDNSRGFPEAYAYPIYEYKHKDGSKTRIRCDGQRIIPTPEDYIEAIHYQDVDTHFAEYLKSLEDEHSGITDKQLRDSPHGIYIGRGRNARWHDESLRRGIIQ
jgi:hypothetical protein